MEHRIPTFVMNLAERLDRRVHILREFNEKHEFDVQIIPAIKHKNGAFGVWLTLMKIVNISINAGHSFILVVQDDHLFSDSYSPQLLNDAIRSSNERNADVLLGGVSWSGCLLPVSSNLIWVEKFSGMQFMVIFNTFMRRLSLSSFEDYNACDYRISDMSDDIYMIYPPFSTQCEFGYSDVTPRNGNEGLLSTSFDNTRFNVVSIIERYSWYKSHSSEFDLPNEDNFSIPTYVFCGSNEDYGEQELAQIFDDQNGLFRLYMKQSIGISFQGAHEIHWKDLQDIAKICIEESEDFFIVCRSNFVFSSSYSPKLLLDSIVTAFANNCDVLLGSYYGRFSHALPINETLYWFNSFPEPYETSMLDFAVIFYSAFDRITSGIPNREMTADTFLANICTEKMLIWPFFTELKKEHRSGPSVHSVYRNRQLLADVSSSRLHRIRRISRMNDNLD